MTTGIEFEKKFVLDLRKADQISGDLSVRSLQKDHAITSIRQYYDKNGERFRASQTSGPVKFVRETKRRNARRGNFAERISGCPRPLPGGCNLRRPDK